jgi:hypothetical protein
MAARFSPPWRASKEGLENRIFATLPMETDAAVQPGSISCSSDFPEPRQARLAGGVTQPCPGKCSGLIAHTDWPFCWANPLGSRAGLMDLAPGLGRQFEASTR